MSNLNPHISVDCAIFGYDLERLNVLLIQRGTNALTGDPRFAIPGDLIRDDEDLPQAAQRVLEDLTGLQDIYIQQVGAFGDPNRTNTEEDKQWLRSIREKPQARVVTIGFYALVNMQNKELRTSSFAEKALWVPLDEVGDLAFDHNAILDNAYTLLRKTVKVDPVGYKLLPDKFTMRQLQTLYEAILNKTLDKRNFRRKINRLGILKKLEEQEQGVTHKPSQYYSFDMAQYDKLVRADFEDFAP